MTSHIAMEPPGASPGERVRFVPDRFMVTAFLLPLVWLVFHRLWLQALLVLAAYMALASLAAVPGYAGLPLALALLLSLLVALEGPAWRIAAMRHRGWRQTRLIEARNRDEAEIRYFSAGLPPSAASQSRPAPAIYPARPGDAGMLGMTDYPGAG